MQYGNSVKQCNKVQKVRRDIDNKLCRYYLPIGCAKVKTYMFYWFCIQLLVLTFGADHVCLFLALPFSKLTDSAKQVGLVTLQQHSLVETTSSIQHFSGRIIILPIYRACNYFFFSFNDILSFCCCIIKCCYVWHQQAAIVSHKSQIRPILILQLLHLFYY